MRIWLCIVAFGVMIGLSSVWDRGDSGSDGRTELVAGRSGSQPASPATPGGSQAVGDETDGSPLTTRDPLVPPALAIAAEEATAAGPFRASDWSRLDDSLLPDDDFSSDDRAAFHAHGQKFCASGCAVSNHPTGELTKPLFRRLLAEYAEQSMDETSRALESLVYYGRQTRQLIESEGMGLLDPSRAAVLRRELSRTHARISIRVVDERGTVRASLPPTRVPLDRRHVFRMDTNDVQPLVTSGTVKRVGLHHLWNRL